MSKKYIQPGSQIDAVAPAGGVVSGTAYYIGGLAGVALSTADAGEQFALMTDGVHSLPVTGGPGAAFGAPVYMNVSTNALTVTSATGLYRVGNVVKPLDVELSGTNATAVRLGIQGALVPA